MPRDVRHKPLARRKVTGGTGPGSQPREQPPPGWPVFQGELVTHVYRSMRVDRGDLQMVREDMEKMQGYERGGDMFKSETPEGSGVWF